ncbi:M1 family metallopeptidase [Chitinophaga qingshengii]|uniref:M1 family peptidase n=1 Tax=Chitinophaga qingshengii TaxID=1569794 RepID=A0ABR7TYK5_9BACT|nr:M1 family metallopeptidase [Chitinophaga qingshengii]MBC9934900.1 M1 family peptidase [Chitinophaga qingshengii]
MKVLLFALMCCSCLAAQGQMHSGTADTTWKRINRSAETTVNDVVHTKLDLKADFTNGTLSGKAWITLRPHLHPTDSLCLDAKRMNIYKVALASGKNSPALKYTYKDSMQLVIRLDKVYTSQEDYTILVEYQASNNHDDAAEVPSESYNAGLHFVRDTSGNGYTQLWTQGEPEFSSCWFPTIDKPDQRTSAEIRLTVPDKYATLSNGELVIQQPNIDHTRTDTWKMDLSHAPYLFFIGAGVYDIVKERYRNIDAYYYMEKGYKDISGRIFGRVPAILGFFSDRLNTPYPWNKYAQITGHDYSRTAMENTTAVLTGTYILKNERELVDGTLDELDIVHEIAHHWFGNLVTPKSWSYLCLSEGLACYSEYLWAESHYKKEQADALRYSMLKKYTGDEKNREKALVRYFYPSQGALFDAVSYEKGAGVMHMLRHYVGDTAFFRALHLYLEKNRFKSVEAADLRQAFEKVAGKDLNWFWDQWFYKPGHPQLNIHYNYDTATRKVLVAVTQMQTSDVYFKAPVGIDIYVAGQKESHEVWIDGKTNTFTFPLSQRPDLVDFDGERTLVCERHENKTLVEYLFQYKNAGSYIQQLETVQFALNNPEDTDAVRFLLSVLQNMDTNSDFRNLILEKLKREGMPEPVIPVIEELAANEKNRLNKALAIELLGGLRKKQYEPLFLQQLYDSSYTVAGAALEGLLKVDEQKAVAVLPTLHTDVRGNLSRAYDKVVVLTKTDDDFNTMYNKFTTQTLLKAYYENFGTLFNFITYLKNVQDVSKFTKGVEAVVKLRSKVVPYSTELVGMINEALRAVKAHKKNMINTEAANNNDLAKQVNMLDKNIGKN